jgi:hypothetical protein
MNIKKKDILALHVVRTYTRYIDTHRYIWWQLQQHMANLRNHPLALTLKQSALQPTHTLVISGNAARLSSILLVAGHVARCTTDSYIHTYVRTYVHARIHTDGRSGRLLVQTKTWTGMQHAVAPLVKWTVSEKHREIETTIKRSIRGLFGSMGLNLV